MKRIAVVLFLVAAPLAAQSDADLVRQGIVLFDQGRIDEAIAKYREALAKNPANLDATYELALSYTQKRDFQQCRALLEPALKLEPPQRAILHTALGNCVDAGGDTKKAVEIYREGVKLAPDEPGLAYNLAVSLVALNQLDEARQLFERDVASQPQHASGHYSLARVFEAQKFRLPAFLEYLRFLAIEPSGARAKFAAQHALALMNLGVETKGKDINITLDPDSRKEEGDFSALETTLGIVSAASVLTEEKKLDPAARLSAQVGDILAIISESSAKMSGEQYVFQNVIPFFNAMVERKLVTPFTYIAFSSLGLDGSRKWMEANRAAVDKFNAWIALAGKTNAIPIPEKTP